MFATDPSDGLMLPYILVLGKWYPLRMAHNKTLYIERDFGEGAGIERVNLTAIAKSKRYLTDNRQLYDDDNKLRPNIAVLVRDYQAKHPVSTTPPLHHTTKPQSKRTKPPAARPSDEGMMLDQTIASLGQGGGSGSGGDGGGGGGDMGNFPRERVTTKKPKIKSIVSGGTLRSVPTSHEAQIGGGGGRRSERKTRNSHASVGGGGGGSGTVVAGGGGGGGIVGSGGRGERSTSTLSRHALQRTLRYEAWEIATTYAERRLSFRIPSVTLDDGRRWYDALQVQHPNEPIMIITYVEQAFGALLAVAYDYYPGLTIQQLETEVVSYVAASRKLRAESKETNNDFDVTRLHVYYEEVRAAMIAERNQQRSDSAWTEAVAYALALQPGVLDVPTLQDAEQVYRTLAQTERIYHLAESIEREVAYAIVLAALAHTTHPRTTTTILVMPIRDPVLSAKVWLRIAPRVQEAYRTPSPSILASPLPSPSPLLSPRHPSPLRIIPPSSSSPPRHLSILFMSPPPPPSLPFPTFSPSGAPPPLPPSSFTRSSSLSFLEPPNLGIADDGRGVGGGGGGGFPQLRLLSTDQIPLTPTLPDLGSDAQVADYIASLSTRRLSRESAFFLQDAVSTRPFSSNLGVASPTYRPDVRLSALGGGGGGGSTFIPGQRPSFPSLFAWQNPAAQGEHGVPAKSIRPSLSSSHPHPHPHVETPLFQASVSIGPPPSFLLRPATPSRLHRTPHVPADVQRQMDDNFRRFVDTQTNRIPAPDENKDAGWRRVSVAPGTRVGDYYVLEWLGRGTFGDVYKAAHQSMATLGSAASTKLGSGGGSGSGSNSSSSNSSLSLGGSRKTKTKGEAVTAIAPEYGNVYVHEGATLVAIKLMVLQTSNPLGMDREQLMELTVQTDLSDSGHYHPNVLPIYTSFRVQLPRNKRVLLALVLPLALGNLDDLIASRESYTGLLNDYKKLEETRRQHNLDAVAVANKVRPIRERGKNGGGGGGGAGRSGRRGGGNGGGVGRGRGGGETKGLESAAGGGGGGDSVFGGRTRLTRQGLREEAEKKGHFPERKAAEKKVKVEEKRNVSEAPAAVWKRTRIEVRREARIEENLRQTQNLVCGMQWIHANGFVHQDLKPGNALVGFDGVLRLGDFGMSRSRSARLPPADARPTSDVGTPEFAAPENSCGRSAGVKFDYWSLGVLLIELWCGVRPFYTERRVPALPPGRDASEYVRQAREERARRLQNIRARLGWPKQVMDEYKKSSPELDDALRAECEVLFVEPTAETSFVDFASALLGVAKAKAFQQFYGDVLWDALMRLIRGCLRLDPHKRTLDTTRLLKQHHSCPVEPTEERKRADIVTSEFKREYDEIPAVDDLAQHMWNRLEQRGQPTPQLSLLGEYDRRIWHVAVLGIAAKALEERYPQALVVDDPSKSAMFSPYVKAANNLESTILERLSNDIWFGFLQPRKPFRPPHSLSPSVSAATITTTNSMSSSTSRGTK
jgi:serine/threonine protein kinase